MELLVRIAMDKYYRQGWVKDPSDAVEKFFDHDGVIEWLNDLDSA